jgi:hypothetical protein
MEKQYIYVEVSAEIKEKAVRLAKKSDLSMAQWIRKLIKGAKK